MPATVRTLAEITADAEKLVDQKQYQKAHDLLQEGRGLSGTPADEGAYHFTLGSSLLGLKRVLEASQSFRRSAELFDTAGQWDKRGAALEQAAGASYSRRAYKDALEQYKNALNIYKSHDAKQAMARTLRTIGNVQVDLQEKPAAAVTFKEARRLAQEAGDEEGVAIAVMNQASLLFEQEGRSGAIREYRTCVDQDGCGHHLALNNLGFLLMLDGQTDEALTTLQRAEVDLNKRGVNDEDGGLLNLNLGHAYLLKKQLDKAEKHLQQAMAHFASEGATRAIELVVLANEAVRDQGFDPFILTDDGVKEAVARMTLAVVRVGQGRLDDALAEANRAVALDGQLAYVHAGLGWIHVARQEGDAATAAFRRAAGKEPNNAQLKKALDHVNPYVSARVGRNDACPCGSGKKFKKCHGAG